MGRPSRFPFFWARQDLRRLFAIKLAEAGAKMHDSQQVLGPASAQTTERYYAQFSTQHSARKILWVLQSGKGDGNKSGTSPSREEAAH